MTLGHNYKARVCGSAVDNVRQQGGVYISYANDFTRLKAFL